MPQLDLSEVGLSGLPRMGGTVYEEFLPQLQGLKAVKVYREMSTNDPVVGAILFAVDMLLRQVSWRVEPASPEAADQEAAEFLESCLGDMSVTWEDTVSEILSMLVYGWSYHEIVYKRRLGDQRDPTKRSRYTDGRVGWRKIAGRSQDTLYQWEFDDHGGVQAMVQQAPPDYSLRRIPIEKGLLFRTRVHKGSPEGYSVLRNAYRPWYMKKRIEEIEAIGIERDLAGLPIAWVPPELLSQGATAEQKAMLEAIKKIVRNVRRDEQEGIVFPLAYRDGEKVFDFGLLSTGGRRQFDTDAVVARYDQRIAMTILADFILLGHEKVGSLALSTSKTKLFTIACSAWLDSIAAVLNRHAVPRLFVLNGLDTERLPRLVPGEVDAPDLKELGEFVKNLAGTGMELFPDDKLENYLRQAAKLPAKEAEAV